MADDETTGDEIEAGKQPAPRRGRGRRKDPLGPDSEIGSRLRKLYSEVESEPIPAQLLDLLERLSEAEATAAK